ncbi:MAG: nucleotidyltransferase domain-containing protein [Trueperaceae bacterium]|nr:nucleotidyltransferase domain-containing protein [Trueperaceae bacterium]
MFTPTQRSSLLKELIRAAEDDDSVVGAVQVGSLAKGDGDEWSDIDLMLRIEPEGDMDAVVARWTERFYAAHGAVHHLDVRRGATLYRVFLLDTTLQVDVSFWPFEQFVAYGHGFKQLFGDPIRVTEPAESDAAQLLGMAWLYALHSRSSIARGKPWQAVTMLDELRDQVLALACLRHGLRAYQGRDADRLPDAVKAELLAARARSISLPDLAASHAALLRMLMSEARHVLGEGESTARLERALETLAQTAT